MDTEQKRKAAREEMELAERTLAESIKRRDQARQKYQTTTAPLLTAAVCVFIAGWIAHILAKIFQWPSLLTITIAGVIAGGPAYFWTMRAARQQIIESSLIKRTISYPGFKKKYSRVTSRNFVACFFVFLAVLLAPIIGGHFYPLVFTQKRFDTYFPFALGFILVLFFYSVLREAHVLRSVRCPTCKTKLVVRKNRPETRDYYSGFCKRCNVLWDLDVSSNSD